MMSSLIIAGKSVYVQIHNKLIAIKMDLIKSITKKENIEIKILSSNASWIQQADNVHLEAIQLKQDGKNEVVCQKCNLSEHKIKGLEKKTIIFCTKTALEVSVRPE